jgi:hypothetical protein
MTKVICLPNFGQQITFITEDAYVPGYLPFPTMDVTYLLPDYKEWQNDRQKNT